MIDGVRDGLRVTVALGVAACEGLVVPLIVELCTSVRRESKQIGSAQLAISQWPRHKHITCVHEMKSRPGDTTHDDASTSSPVVRAISPAGLAKLQLPDTGGGNAVIKRPPIPAVRLILYA